MVLVLEVGDKYSLEDYERLLKKPSFYEGRLSLFESPLIMKDWSLAICVWPDECHECGCKVQIRDEFRGEILCNCCGLVLRRVTDYASFLDNKIITKHYLPDTNTNFRKDEKKIIAILKNKPYHTPKKDHRTNEKLYFMRNRVANPLNMTHIQKKRLENIIREMNLKRIHSTITWEKIILGMAIEILRQDGRIIVQHSKIISEIGLKTSQRRLIRRNMLKLRV